MLSRETASCSSEIWTLQTSLMVLVGFSTWDCCFCHIMGTLQWKLKQKPFRVYAWNWTFYEKLFLQAHGKFILLPRSKQTQQGRKQHFGWKHEIGPMCKHLFRSISFCYRYIQHVNAVKKVGKGISTWTKEQGKPNFQKWLLILYFWVKDSFFLLTSVFLYFHNRTTLLICLIDWLSCKYISYCKINRKFWPAWKI